MSALVNLSSEARKFGIYLALTATDPTERALGGRGMTIRSQMARIVFGMKDADASRKILGSIQGFPNGSVGLPTGQFVSNIMGKVEHGVAFHPSTDEVLRYLAAREVRPNPLPDVVIHATQLPSGVWSAGPTIALPPTQAEIDGKALDGRVSQCASLRAVGEVLYGLEPGGSVSGEMIGTRITPALEWRLKHLNCPDALRLLSKSGKWVEANNGRLAMGVSA